MNNRIITIDGPAGAGKTTVAKLVAVQTGLPLLLSGKLYRVAVWALQKRSVDLHDEVAVEAMLPALPIQISTDGLIEYDGAVVGDEVHAEEIGTAAAVIAHYVSVRAYARDMQRAFGLANGCVIEGRVTAIDIFPEASLKVWLTADLAERTRRTAAVRGPAAAKMMRQRDEQDSSRQLSPMRPADGAVEIDATDLTAGQVVVEIVNLLV